MENYRLELKGTEESQTGCRSLVYSLLSRAFRFPGPELYDSIKAGKFADEAQGALTTLPYNGLKGGELGRGLASSCEALQGNYIELFEVGGNSGSPCPLYEGEYGGGRMKVMEEVLRFYHHFGLRLSTEKRDRPDHLATELEFMHLLTFKETEAVVQGGERRTYLRAEQDFLRFHLSDLLAAVAKKMEGVSVPFYQDLAGLGYSFCQKELAYLQSQVKGGQGD